ncbi:MAG TPA: asparagine synthase (glutamine-hydrolyzing), partial [Candidatus Polarisedimenticolaceae bacterium]|nr:asparagine synthase (glutamine-hydrolyzing) [Candidatus Polarisedimenticolaceae bacterium]
MCGICGILQPEGDRTERMRLVRRMSAALRHRGPDDSGEYGDETVSLGFRRLAVIDLVTGNQPIRLEDERAAIVLNGEIYNFRELRRELEGRQRFHTQGDVEVALRMYAAHGVAGLARLNGMFALAIWDRERRTLVLARDRFGIKPLFVYREPGRLAFASELSALLAAGLPPERELDRLELRHFLSQKYTSPAGTILRGVRSIEPATVLEIGPGGERVWRYWEPESLPAPRLDEDEAAEALEHALGDAVRRQLVADVPVGLFLSGGVDSSSLAALVARQGAGPLDSFSVGFEGAEAASELGAARRVAERLGTRHQEILLGPRRVRDDLERILARLDGALGDATCIPTWYMSALARGTVTVALSGEGADEIFGGYARQRYDAWLDRLGPGARRWLPLALRAAGRPPS